ncbi:tRNA pseudouridine synthase [Fragilaria crotonensis]|nr:tRNA pseudouridine synthase [Fragilaria crotonensis]
MSPQSIGLIRYRARIAYDGSGFQGFQLQPGIRTVQGELEQILDQRFQRQIRVVGAGRTDTGVHARGQAVHFDLMESDILQKKRQSRQQQDEVSALQYSMNRMLRHDLQVYNLQIAPLVNKTVKGVVGEYPWHATYDATGKLYIYRISAASVMDPLERHNRFDLSWKQSTDLEVLQRMLKKFEGTHDFRAFAAGIDVKERFADGVLDTRRTVYNIEMVKEGAGMYRIEVRIKGALYKMIRNMVGTALDVAWGNISEEQFLMLLHSGARRQANKSKPAPPEGLTLEQVYYDDY